MPDKTWADGNVPIAADFNTYFRDQVVTSCTSGTRPASPVDGRVIFETDTRLFMTYSTTATAWVTLANASTFQSFTPTWTASTTNPTLGNGTFSCRYHRVGRLITASYALDLGSTTTIGSGTYTFSLPVTANGSNNYCGSGYMVDSSVGTVAPVTSFNPTASTTTCTLLTTSGVSVSSSAPWTWATSDSARWTFTYEAAA